MSTHISDRQTRLAVKAPDRWLHWPTVFFLGGLAAAMVALAFGWWWRPPTGTMVGVLKPRVVWFGVIDGVVMAAVAATYAAYAGVALYKFRQQPLEWQRAQLDAERNHRHALVHLRVQGEDGHL